VRPLSAAVIDYVLVGGSLGRGKRGKRRVEGEGREKREGRE
jgi:hypothetical protein